jgi:hypothetical protein
MTARKLKPRPATVLRASFVSQETSLALLALVGRKFLEVIVPRCERVTRIGKTVLVELDEAERVIRELGAAVTSDGDQSEPTDQPQTANDVLRAIGFEVAS